ncbi:MAG TPA: UrcA family protein [Micropepsaceae bacterium]|jgi:UrcA family protein
MLRIIATAAFFALTLNAAQAAEAPPSINVAFGDLNLSRSADTKILAERLEIAAAKVCRGAGAGLSPVAEMYVVRGCVKDAIHIALASIASRQTNATRADLIGSRKTLASN